MANDLPRALSDSLNENITSLATDTLEIGIDAFLEDGVGKDIPLLSTVVGIYKIGKSVNELYLLKKLEIFVIAMNDGIANQEDIDKHKSLILSNPKQRSKEIEFLLILINRYINENKPILLAKIYLAYLNSIIKWDNVIVFAEIIDHLLPGDYEFLVNNNEERILILNNRNSDKALRLSAVGLIELCVGRLVANVSLDAEEDTSPENQVITNEYRYTSLGKRFVSIIK